jgi:hypothetical protein
MKGIALFQREVIGKEKKKPFKTKNKSSPEPASQIQLNLIYIIFGEVN